MILGTDTMFGSHAQRLGRMKAAYGRTNVFQLNNNILPML
jgi:hypothetical protein